MKSLRLGQGFLATFPKTDFGEFVVKLDAAKYESPVGITIFRR
ncbi:unnamed protein product, partial [marine sediment metagenome]